MRAILVVLCVICVIGFVAAGDALLTVDEPAPAHAAVGAPRLVFVGVDAQGGNGDIWPEPGETVNLRVELYNRGDELATSVFGTLDYLGTNTQVTILDKTASWPNLVAKGAPQFTSAPHFQIQLGSTLACGARLPFRVSVTTGTGHVFNLEFTVRLGQKTDYDALVAPGVPRVNEHEVIISGAAAGFGAGLATTWADRNGDGFADGFVGAPAAVGGLGRVYHRLAPSTPGLFWGSNDLGIPKGSPWSQLNGADAGDNAGNSLASCDVNGDGFDDILIGAQNGDGAADAVLDSGEVYLLYGNGVFVNPTVLEAPHASIAHFWGDDVGDNTSNVGCGDVNGDGYDDLLLGAINADSIAEGRPSAGEVFLVYGRSTQWVDTDLGVATPGISRFSGATAGDILGFSLATGDVNGDGFDDMIFGAPGGDSIGETRAGAGEVYLVYGQAPAWAGADLLTPPAGVVRFWGVDPADNFGVDVDSADVDGDGFDDIIIGANTADSVGNSRADAGEVTIIYGRAANWTDTDVANPPAGVAIVYGADAFDLFGIDVAAGDVNGDGYADVAVGASIADSSANGRLDAGEVTVVYGGSTRLGEVDVLVAPGLVSRFYGPDAGDQAGRGISIADTNGDGFDDLLISATGADSIGNTRADAGEVYLLYGKPTESFQARPDAFAFIDASAGTKLTLCDDCSAAVPIGFSFPFYGDERTTVHVGSNGLLSFAPINDLASAVPLCLPSRNPSDELIAPFWDDLNPEAGGPGSGVFTLLEGVAPNRRLTIEWKDIPHYPAIGAATFEVTLFESTGDVLFQYQDTTFGNAALDNGAAAVAGAENRKGVYGYAHSCFSGTDLVAGTAARLSPTTPLLDSRHASFFGATSAADGLWGSAGSSCEPNEHTTDAGTAPRYYGLTASCTYDNGVAHAGSTRFVTIPDFPADARITYWSRRQTDGGGATDLSTIQVSVAGIGGPYVDAASNTDNSNAWRHSGYNNLFGFAGSSVDLRFRFDTVNAVSNAFLGWMIDDVQISGCDATGAAFGAEAFAFAHPPVYCEQTSGLVDSLGSACGDGGAPASFQWREDGATIPGANQLQYTVPASQPPGIYGYSVDIGCLGGGSDTSLDAGVEIVAKPGVGPSMALAKAGGVTQLHFSWSNVASAQDYVVFQDGSPSGTFVTTTGTSPSGLAGLTVPMPAGNVYFLVTGRNDVCGLGPKQ